MNRLARWVSGFAFAAVVSGCAALGIPVPADVAAVPVAPPTVTFSGATLARAPSSRALAAHYCPELVSGAFGAGAFLCEQAFGAPPAPVDMTVSFDLRFHVANPNQVPLPLASALVATTLFPSTTAEQLGAACVTLCAAGAPCTGAPTAGACDASSRDVRSLSDFAGRALPQLLLAEGVALAGGRSPTFALPPVVASSAADVVVRYSFGPEQLLSVMKELARQSLDALKAGRPPTFTIPYRLEGTVWFDAGTIGRLAVGWGPVQGTFTLPTDGLRLPQ